MIYFKTIKTKIFVSLLSILIFIMFLFGFLQIKEIKQSEYAHLESMATTINSILVKHIRGYIYELDKENLQISIDSIESNYIKSISILDQDGMTIVSTMKSENTKYESFNELLEQNSHRITTMDEYIIMNNFEVLDVPIGYLVLEADLVVYNAQVKDKMKKLFLFLLVVIIVYSLVSWFIAESINTPLRTIIEKLRLAKENEYLTFEKQPQVEFEFLADSIATKHNELSRLNHYLQDEVDSKTKSLQDLNFVLQHKVKEEVSKRREKDKQMLEQSRLAQMGEMISMIAHQWRQPLSAISSTTNTLMLKNARGNYEQELFDDRLQKISEYSQHLSMTIDDFRNFFKKNKNKEETTFKALIDEVLRIIQVSLENKNIEIDIDFQCNSKMKVYTNEFKQVVLNLIKNAEDALLENKISNPTIKLRTYSEGLHTIFSIEDNAGGIDESIIDKVFDPYFSTKLEKDGTGLGLYMSKTIVEEHFGGKMTVSNGDEGALFKIILQRIVSENSVYEG